MEEIQKTKADIRKEIAAAIGRLSADELAEKTSLIENRLFDFANFLEPKIALMYIENPKELKSA